ncbi:Gfo/Idh/MocA family protein [Flexilinea flocculi]|uniref:Predicted dehydrogenase n=1 Tax=Flexilinea flocculi TaxID=1678840 RepID=A0A0K8PBC0_9CHLR|nr:Gfo/Idh/MocA family oxidoreductase [Flexilinea flocculi]GAP39445.1 predicted dehydrogenase [Flexilinea flocculi]
MEKVRFGIISCAGIAKKRFIPAITGASNALLAAVASRDPEKARQFASDHQIPEAYGSYKTLLNQKDIDAVYIPLPNGLHKEWSIKAIEHGKHVLCEKPLAPTQKDCEELAAAAKANGVTLMEAFMYRFHPLTEFVIRQVHNGELGDIHAIQACFSFVLNDPDNVRFQPDLAGGSVMDVGCYGINCTRTFFNEEPEAVSAVAHYTKPCVDDRMTIYAKFRSGKQAQIICSFSSQAPEGYMISGSKGWIVSSNGFRLGVEHGKIIQEIDGIRSSFEDATNEYTKMIEHFSDCVIHKTAPRYDAIEAGRNMAVICAAMESAEKNGEWVRLK